MTPGTYPDIDAQVVTEPRPSLSIPKLYCKQCGEWLNLYSSYECHPPHRIPFTCSTCHEDGTWVIDSDGSFEYKAGHVAGPP